MAQWRKVVVSGSTAELNDISASGHIVPVTADGGALGSAIYEWSDLYLADSSVINFGADQDTTLTHTDGSGIALNSTNKIGFGGNFNAYIQHDGTDLKLSDDADINLVAGADILLDAATTVKIDSAAGDVSFEDAGTAQLAIDMDGTGGQIDIQLKVASDDLVFKTQGGNEVIRVADDRKLYFYDQGGEHISSDGSILSIAAGAELHLSASMVDIGANSISGSHASSGSFGYLNIHGDAVIAGDLTFGDASTDLITIGADIGSNLTPNVDATYDLGTTSQGWNDLHLGSGGVLNFNNGDVTLTHSSNLLDIDGGNTRVDRLEIDSAADYIDVDTDLKIIAAADIILDPAGGEVDVDGNLIPNTDSSDDLGASGKAWNKLWVDDIDLNAQGSISIGGTGRIDLDGDDDTSIRASADDIITIEAAGADQVAFTDGTIEPSTNDDIALGTTSKMFSDLFLGSGGVINLNNGDVTLTHAAGKLTWGGDGAVEIDFNNHEMTNVDIDSGAIDGTTIGGATPAAGTFTTLVANGNVDLGNATSDTITATAQFDSDLVPSTDSARDLGTTSLYWRNAYIDSITTTGDVTVNGSLDINGTLTTIDTTNLRVADRFIIVASGSTSGDGGIIANTGAAGIGSAFFYDDSASRWALTAADDTSGSATSASPRQYLVSVSQSALPPDDWEGGTTENPSDFGTDAASRRGMIYVQTNDHDVSRTLAGDIWIWS